MSGWTLAPSALLAAAMLASVFRKVTRASSSVALRDRLGVPPRLWSALGALELCAVLGLAAGLARPTVGTAAASGVALLMTGAVLAHLRVGLGGRALLPPAVLLVVAVLAGVAFAHVR